MLQGLAVVNHQNYQEVQQGSYLLVGGRFYQYVKQGIQAFQELEPSIWLKPPGTVYTLHNILASHGRS